MPIAFLKHVPQSLKIFLSMLATGVLIFLLYDVIQQASEPINAALYQLRTQHTGAGTFFLDIFLLICGIGLGSVGLVYFNSFVFKRRLHKKTLTTEAITAASLSQQDPPPVVNTHDVTSKNHGSAPVLTASRVAPAAVLSKGELDPHMLALLIATGIGLHNFSEGLAIGQSAAVGAIQLAVVLIIGFGLHNMTEGFGIAGPLT